LLLHHNIMLYFTDKFIIYLNIDVLTYSANNINEVIKSSLFKKCTNNKYT